MDETKSLLASKTFWGIMICLLAPVLSKLGLRVSDDATIQMVAETLTSTLGAVVAIYGRITADKLIA